MPLWLWFLHILVTIFILFKCGRKTKKKGDKTKKKSKNASKKIDKVKSVQLTPVKTVRTKRTTTTTITDMNPEVIGTDSNSAPTKPLDFEIPPLKIDSLKTAKEDEKVTETTTGTVTTTVTPCTTTTTVATTPTGGETEENKEEIMHRCRDYTPDIFKDLGHLFELLKE